ncbi:MAG: hypothetical protein A3J30_01955 [Candidatus Wildermuthbacteria bacterium RIFCSPLOWO2_02_FULL_47_9c]|uniref:Uncharacterized protein n=3 Tax=Patescibacteria group TaxID=1783273 RepID=A0A837IKA3_9BACT|nr:MAG: hypothetical protein UU67_C0028G0017 [Candidatus Daviesbacteria bacterium GW2011_GWB1_41_5]KKU92783.1 MAG: hypothetical protein UY25_C0006G0005 [Candidatus Yanofskybacteria bacterium GW2011_GWC1_48_11]OHA71887.1 MAG: hypothetical protein A3E08_03860 [Candidatus Wildermuthbacteria bacterium RIFCSPHIGHO2_12_FULL_49_13]OHA77057.1 MAG: hypothetical protein A3J30_01955 [Candidatus Wildermuthbacteria bacterium RIFCSPLOWO2_02_FULL_47_9c]OHA77953.1 MAG: hypothetical protein A2564_01760 [Candida
MNPVKKVSRYYHTKLRARLARIIFGIHFLIGALWVGLFFVPPTLWTSKISFHFFFTWGVVIHQMIWGAILMLFTKRYELVCILTTLEQIAKGEKLSEARKYRHMIIKKFFEKAGWGMPQRGATVLTLFALLLVTFQYLFLS